MREVGKCPRYFGGKAVSLQSERIEDAEDISSTRVLALIFCVLFLVDL